MSSPVEVIDRAVADFDAVVRALGFEPRRGNRAACIICDASNETTFSFKPDAGIWNCFRCGRDGGALDLVQGVLNCSRSEALRWLADFFALPLDDRHTTSYERRQWAERRRRAKRWARDLADWRWRVMHALRVRRNDLWDAERLAASWARSHLTDPSAADDPRWAPVWGHAFDDQRGDLVERLLKLFEAAPAETLAKLRANSALADISTASLAELNALRTTLEAEHGT